MLPPASTVVDVWRRGHGESHTSAWSFHISLVKGSHMTTPRFKEASNLQRGRRKRQIRIFLKDLNDYHSIQEVTGNECSHVWLLTTGMRNSKTTLSPSHSLQKPKQRDGSQTVQFQVSNTKFQCYRFVPNQKGIVVVFFFSFSKKEHQEKLGSFGRAFIYS